MLRCSRPILAASLAILCTASHGEIIDRIAVTVDNTVVTESEILRQIRLTAFQNGEKPDFSGSAKRDAAEKLVEQILIRREMETTKYATVDPPSVEPLLDEFRKKYGGDAGLRKALQSYGLTEQELDEQLRWQATLIPFIDVRFKPGVQIPERDLHEYYEKTLLPEWRKTGKGTPPSFEESREAAESVLTGRRADQALDFWLGEARRQSRIRFHQEAFR